MPELTSLYLSRVAVGNAIGSYVAPTSAAELAFAATRSFDGRLVGSGALIKIGNEDLNFGGSSPDFTGRVEIAGGTLNLIWATGSNEAPLRNAQILPHDRPGHARRHGQRRLRPFDRRHQAHFHDAHRRHRRLRQARRRLPQARARRRRRPDALHRHHDRAGRLVGDGGLGHQRPGALRSAFLGSPGRSRRREQRRPRRCDRLVRRPGRPRHGYPRGHLDHRYPRRGYGHHHRHHPRRRNHPGPWPTPPACPSVRSSPASASPSTRPSPRSRPMPASP